MGIAEKRLNAGFADQLLMFSELATPLGDASIPCRAAIVEGDGVPGRLRLTAENIP